MNVLILGAGGREHALAWKITQSNTLNRLYVAPGNAGTHSLATNLAISYNDFPAVEKAVIEYGIDLIIVGPEEPLVKGITDYFSDSKVAVIGPSKKAAQLEGSKSFAKRFMCKHHIPTATYKTITKENVEEGELFLKELSPPYVLKADGLAAGKGVLIISDRAEALAMIHKMLEGKFGTASSRVVIEDYLQGNELSVFVLAEGENYKVLGAAKDYKRIGEGDTGLNTGGMGAISPVPFTDKALLDKIEQKIIMPTINGLTEENIYFQGFIFFGLMIVNSEPKLLEYNVRLGDPETQVILPLIQSDFLALLNAATSKNLNEFELKFKSQVASTVVLASEGYPQSYETHKVISISGNTDNCHIFHAGTVFQNSKLYTNGGRVMAVTGLGNNMRDALNNSYENIKKIKFKGKYFRTDIGYDL